MEKLWRVLIGFLMIMTLVGCSTPNSEMKSDEQVSAEISQGGRLRDDYDDALSIQGQLAVGTLLLEETELAVDEVIAGELLPLWRVAQSLMNSDTTAALEIEAVYNQIQDTMTLDQISAIAKMELTEESLSNMMEEGELSIGRGGLAGDRGRGTGDKFQSPDGGFGPGGGLPGGGPGEGPGDGLPEGMDPEAMATRQAQFAEGGLGNSTDVMLITAVIRTLEMKTGEVFEDQTARPYDLVYSVIAEATGLSLEEIRAMTTEGMTLTEIVETNGGDIEEVRNSLIEVLSELPNAAEVDLEGLASDWLGLDK